MEIYLAVSTFQIGQQLLHSRQLGRLDEVVIESRFCRSPPILLLAPAGQCRQGGLFKSGRLTNSASDLVPVHAWHSDVEKDHVRPESHGDLQGRGAVVRNPDLVSLQPQQHRETEGGITVVIHDQQPMPGTGSGQMLIDHHLRLFRL